MYLRLMYLRLGFWTLAGSYIAFIFARNNSASGFSLPLTAAFFGAIMGFSLGGMFANRDARKRS